MNDSHEMTIIWIVVSCFLQGTENCEKTSEPCPVFVDFSRDFVLFCLKQDSSPKNFSHALFSPLKLFSFHLPCFEEKTLEFLLKQGKSGLGSSVPTGQIGWLNWHLKGNYEEK